MIFSLCSSRTEGVFFVYFMFQICKYIANLQHALLTIIFMYVNKTEFISLKTSMIYFEHVNNYFSPCYQTRTTLARIKKIL